jgi:hypothetical protein
MWLVVGPLGFHLLEALKGGVFSPPSFFLLRSPLYVNMTNKINKPCVVKKKKKDKKKQHYFNMKQLETITFLKFQIGYKQKNTL